VTSADFPPRAPRFPMRLSLRYRAVDAAEWLNATTENVSASGVLFVTDRPEVPGTPVEMSLLMPRKIFRKLASRVLCRGCIVRTVAATTGGRAAMAATIARYQFVRGDDWWASSSGSTGDETSAS